MARAISSFTKMGFDVLVPLTESASYNLVVDTGQILRKIQVRFTSTNEVDLRIIHSNSNGYVVKKTKKNAYDWLYVLCSDEKEYLIKRCLHGRRSIKPKESDLI